MEIFLKGFVSHSHKNRTNVKVDYAYVNVTAEEMLKMDQINSLLIGGEIIPEEVVSNPFFITGAKCRKFHLGLKLKSFRQMNKYYDNLAQQVGNSLKKKNSSKEEFKYTAPGLFR